MSNSPLVSYTKLSPNCGNYIDGVLVKNRTHAIDKVTIHHTAGVAAIEVLGNIFAQPARCASSNYGIGKDGRVGLFVPEDIRAWTSGSTENDNRAITIEVSNDQLAPTWHVSDEVYNVLIDLVVDICIRNGIKALNWTGDKNGNLTIHKMFEATACPGPYLESKMPEIAKAVNERLNAKQNENEAGGTIYRVQVGAYKVKANADKMAEKLKAAGYKTFVAETDGIYRVQIGAYREKANAERIAMRLKNEGYKPFITTTENISVPEAPKKSVDELAREVIRGEWGVGADRKKRLTDAGYDYNAVQARVDELMRK